MGVDTCRLNADTGTIMMNVDWRRESSRICFDSAVSCTRQCTLGMSFPSFTVCLKFGVLEWMMMMMQVHHTLHTIVYL